jgi:hypothetical protein
MLGNFSFPNNFPVTPKNDRLLKHARLLDVLNKVYVVDGEAWFGGNRYDECKVLIVESSRTTYECSIALNGISIELKERSLRDLKFPLIPTPKTISGFNDFRKEINQIKDAGLDVPIVFNPIVGRNFFDSDDNEDPFLTRIRDYYDERINRYTGDQFTSFIKTGMSGVFRRWFALPQVFDHTVLKAIFAEFDYKVEGSFIADAQQKKLCMTSNRLLRVQNSKLSQVFSESENAHMLVFDFSKSSHVLNQDPMGKWDFYENQDFNFYLDIPIPPVTEVVNKDCLLYNFVAMRTYTVRVRGRISAKIAGSVRFFLLFPGTMSQRNLPSVTATEFFEEFEFEDSFVHVPTVLGETRATLCARRSNFPFSIVGEEENVAFENVSFEIYDSSETAPDAIDDIDIAQHLPDVKLNDYIKSLMHAFKLETAYDPVMRVVRFDYAKDKLSADYVEFDESVSKDYIVRPNEYKGVELAWNFQNGEDALFDNNFRAQNSDNYIGAHVSQPETAQLGDVYLDLRLNAYVLVKQLGVAKISDNHQILRIDGGEKKLAVNAAPVLMTTFSYQDGYNFTSVMPEFGMKGFASFHSLGNENKLIRWGYFLGYVVDDTDEEIPAKYWALSSTPYDKNGVKRGDSYLVMGGQEIVEEGHLQYWKDWSNFLKNSEFIRRNVAVTLEMLSSVFRNKKRIGEVDFIASRMTVELSSGAIARGEIEMYRGNINELDGNVVSWVSVYFPVNNIGSGGGSSARLAPGGGEPPPPVELIPPVHIWYESQEDMIDDQENQILKYFYHDGTDYWEYLGTTVGDIGDYRKVGGGGITPSKRIDAAPTFYANGLVKISMQQYETFELFEERFEWNSHSQITKKEVKDELRNTWVRAEYTWTGNELAGIIYTPIAAWSIT